MHQNWENTFTANTWEAKITKVEFLQIFPFPPFQPPSLSGLAEVCKAWCLRCWTTRLPEGFDMNWSIYRFTYFIHKNNEKKKIYNKKTKNAWSTNLPHLGSRCEGCLPYSFPIGHIHLQNHIINFNQNDDYPLIQWFWLKMSNNHFCDLYWDNQ